MKRLLLSILALFVAGSVARGEEVRLETLAPRAVNAGEVFRVEFVINAKPSEFNLPTIEGFEVLAGPSQSSSSSVSIVNGDISKVTTVTYTYVVQGFTAGVHTIPAATARVKGQDYTSKPLKIEVVAGGDNGGGAQQATGAAGASGQGQQTASGEPAVSGDDLFGRVVVSKSNVYKGEPIHVAFKIYSRGLAVSQFLDAKIASFNGFWSQDLGIPISQQRETYSGRVYDTWTVWEYLLYPQQSGTLTIDPFELTVALQYRVGGSRNLFDEFFGGNIQEVRKKVASAPVKISVKEWPAGAPESFGGAVGQFAMDATPPANRLNANSSGTYTVRISGTGNFPMIRAPKLELPTSFEQYNVTTSESIQNSGSGTTGYRQFAYPFIPRMEGSYTIPEFRFSYFDPRDARYITLTSREIALEVAADSTSVVGGGQIVSGLSKEELKILGRDIRYIKMDAPKLRPKGRLLLWSPVWWLSAVVLVVLFFVVLVVLGRWVRNMQNDKFVRGKRANKVALRRFRAAEASMKQGDRQAFYDEMLKALWGYMSDKLDIPMSVLTKERIHEELFERNVQGEQAAEYVRIISACEEAQYAPTSSSQMNELYREGVNLVSELESAIKKKQ
ncbi:MAG: BatD family protein [Rikenellaceae bacterium]|jgi:hypothetical protein|nr:BatD family protein [Rikenellaceae bacterium]